MSRRPVTDMAASVKRRLLDLSKKRGEDFGLVLGRFAVERLLFRLSRSEHATDFVLKGAMLFQLRANQMPHRPTRDLDLLGSGAPDIDRLEAVFRDVCGTAVADDGLVFSRSLVKGERIKDDDEYMGIRLRLEGRMGSARIPLQVDVGFGDAVAPAPRQEQLLTLLDFPSPAMLVYPWEAMIAEKLHAIVEFGMDNSRMKDYFDLHYLSERQAFTGAVLAGAIQGILHAKKNAAAHGGASGAAAGVWRGCGQADAVARVCAETPDAGERAVAHGGCRTLEPVPHASRGSACPRQCFQQVMDARRAVAIAQSADLLTLAQ